MGFILFCLSKWIYVGAMHRMYFSLILHNIILSFLWPSDIICKNGKVFNSTCMIDNPLPAMVPAGY